MAYLQVVWHFRKAPDEFVLGALGFGSLRVEVEGSARKVIQQASSPGPLILNLLSTTQKQRDLSVGLTLNYKSVHLVARLLMQPLAMGLSTGVWGLAFRSQVWHGCS